MRLLTLFLALALAGCAWGQTGAGPTYHTTGPHRHTQIVADLGQEPTRGMAIAVWTWDRHDEPLGDGAFCAGCHRQKDFHHWVVPLWSEHGLIAHFALCEDCERRILRDGVPWSAPATKEATKP